MVHPGRMLAGLMLVAGLANLAQAAFMQIDTSLGSSTALLDTSTNLAWLHLTLTANNSYDTVTSNLGAGGTFDGWRFATPAELVTFFTDYDGGVVNSTNALNLMNDLGGPLSDAANPTNGFHRQSSIGFLNIASGLGHEIFGYIAVDNFFGPSINPNLQGSAVDNVAFSGTGSWLVQDQGVTTPEPGTLVLFLAGAAVLSLFARRRRA